MCYLPLLLASSLASIRRALNSAHYSLLRDHQYYHRYSIIASNKAYLERDVGRISLRRRSTE